jgi:hypothetical protein
MWLTPDGERVLQAAEAALFRQSRGILVDLVQEDTENAQHLGIALFDDLQPNQKLAVLAQAGDQARRF